MPRGLTKRDTLASKSFGAGDRISTINLDGTDTVDIISIGNPVEKISFQRNGTLQCTVEFSINGVDFQDSIAVTTNTIASYNTHIISHVKVTRTAGEGKLSINLR